MTWFRKENLYFESYLPLGLTLPSLKIMGPHRFLVLKIKIGVLVVFGVLLCNHIVARNVGEAMSAVGGTLDWMIWGPFPALKLVTPFDL